MERRAFLRHAAAAGGASLVAAWAPAAALAQPSPTGRSGRQPAATTVSAGSTYRLLDELPVLRAVTVGTVPWILSEVLVQPLSAVSFDLPAGDGPLWVRSHGAHGWSAWDRLAATEHGPDTDGPLSDRTASELSWRGRATAFQLARPGRTDLDGVRAHLIDTLSGPGGGDVLDPVWRLLGRRARAPARPPIVTRRGWGANESWRRGAPSYATPRRAILHHTAGGTGYSRQEAPAVVRAIYHYHTRVIGWSDLGYNLLVDRFGRIYEGRAGGVDRGVVGAHARGHNTGSIGLAVLGNFHRVRTNAAIRDAVADLLAWKYHAHDIDPRPGRRISHGGRSYPVLCGHRDTGRTVCPGQHLQGDLPRLREAVQSRF